MNKFLQIFFNMAVYGALFWFAYRSILVEQDAWFGFVVVFVLLLALAMSAIPGLRVATTSPGVYPYDD